MISASMNKGKMTDVPINKEGIFINEKQLYKEIDQKAIEAARQMDLLTYLQLREPHNLVRLSANTYSTKEHDSLKISNGKWYQWSRGIGSHSALDYLISVKGYDFVTAIETITGMVIPSVPSPVASESLNGTVKASMETAKASMETAEASIKTAKASMETKPNTAVPAIKNKEQNPLLLPLKNRNNERTIKYLFERGIDYQLICECIASGVIYESADYHNVVFVGLDKNKKPRFATCRGIYGSFKQDCPGSDKRYSFRLMADSSLKDRNHAEVHLFESAVDVLSFASYLSLEGKDYHNTNLLSLSGVHCSHEDSGKIPIALEALLEENPQVNKIILHLDNDRAGRMSAKNLIAQLEKEYKVVDEPPPKGKDFNDFLLFHLGLKNVKYPERGDER